LSKDDPDKEDDSDAMEYFKVLILDEGFFIRNYLKEGPGERKAIDELGPGLLGTEDSLQVVGVFIHLNNESDVRLVSKVLVLNYHTEDAKDEEKEDH